MKKHTNPNIQFTPDAVIIEVGDGKVEAKRNDKLFKFIPMLALVFLVIFVAFIIYSKKYEQLTAFDFILFLAFLILFIRDRFLARMKIIAESFKRESIKEVIIGEQSSGYFLNIKKHKGLNRKAMISDDILEVIELAENFKNNGFLVRYNEKLIQTVERNELSLD